LACGRHSVEIASTTIAELPAHFVDLVGLARERAAGHQKDPVGIEPSSRFGNSFSRGPTENHFFHPAEDDASRLHHRFSSRSGEARQQRALSPLLSMHITKRDAKKHDAPYNTNTGESDKQLQ
jgi:hypothetical protein